MKWRLLSDSKSESDDKKVIKILLQNRGLKSKKETEEFLEPPLPEKYTAKDLEIDQSQLDKSLTRIKSAIKNEEPIVVYGDYDADGICSTAIWWESLTEMGAKVMPFIPLREKEGYGLSKEGIESIRADKKYNINQNAGLLIAVDSGIVANEAIDHANKLGIDVIIVDHHEKPKSLPKAHSVIHTTMLCASGISFFVVTKLLPKNNSLELAAIATVTDLMPLLGVNRSIVKHGLLALNKTTRPGIRAICEVAAIKNIGTYEIGYMIGPRINASGRIENSLLALRLLCTKNYSKALEYARDLNETNKQRQDMMEEQTNHAMGLHTLTISADDKIIVIDHEIYHQGIIGLIAGKLVEKFYLPTIVISKGEKISKASARSITGFNIIEAIRDSDKFLLNAGGHPMAAGFSIETSQIENFKKQIGQLAKEKITVEMLERQQRIDCQLDPSLIGKKLQIEISKFSPFGIGNPEPVFQSTFTVRSTRTVGKDSRHLKLVLSSDSEDFEAIAFGMGKLTSQFPVGQKLEAAYALEENSYNGKTTIQLRVKDLIAKVDKE